MFRSCEFQALSRVLLFNMNGRFLVFANIRMLKVLFD